MCASAGSVFSSTGLFQCEVTSILLLLFIITTILVVIIIGSCMVFFSFKVSSFASVLPQVMRNRDMEERLPTLGDKKKFRKWRQSCLTGEAVVEELVALDMLVERGPDWCYDGDSDDDMTPEDGGPQGGSLRTSIESKHSGILGSS